MDSFTINYKLLLSLFIFVQFMIITPVELSTATWQPMGDPTEYRLVEAVSHVARRPFQLCSKCKCCAAACYVLDCKLPNKPFGTCAFVPKKCDCNSCAA
ncbi:hypothetical protein FCV25MIE_21006 [Fagus crenata]